MECEACNLNLMKVRWPYRVGSISTLGMLVQISVMVGPMASLRYVLQLLRRHSDSILLALVLPRNRVAGSSSRSKPFA